MNGVRTYDERTGLRHAASRLISGIESIAITAFGHGASPFAYTGAVSVALFFICLITGSFILFHYTPDPDSAALDILRLTAYDSPGLIVRAAHRISADLLVIVLIIHVFALWAKGNFRGPLARSWIAALYIIPVLCIVGWAGYVLIWGVRALPILSWGRDLVYSADQWPILGSLHLGSLVGNFLFASQTESSMLLRIFGLHLGGTFLAALLWYFHTRKLTPYRHILPTAGWIVLTLLVLIVSTMMPIDQEPVFPFTLDKIPDKLYIDGILMTPFLFYTLLGAPLLSALLVAWWITLGFVPKFFRDRKISPAIVIESKCTGCRLCLQDCPYDAIIMVSGKSGDHEVARVVPADCTSCGICVGACTENAIELPDYQTKDIRNQLDSFLSGFEPSPTSTEP